MMILFTFPAMVCGFLVASNMNDLGPELPDPFSGATKGPGHSVCIFASLVLLGAFLCELPHMVLVMIFGDELLPAKKGGDGMTVPVININQAINNSSESNNTITNSNGPSALAVAPPAPEVVASKRCRECEAKCSEVDKFCSTCGAKSPAMDILCGSCGKGLQQATKFCDECGQSTQQLCVSCHAGMTQGVKFCGACGHDNTQPPKFSQA
eukprot:m.35770 g.35770  ORF g.35770 m.35770 type:complete len:210 (+) comp14431_c0_seq3:290-919(+)